MGDYDAGAHRSLAIYGSSTPMLSARAGTTIPTTSYLHPCAFTEVLYGRGAGGKGGLMAFVNAVSAIREVEGALPLNLMFLCEGEEFLGSPHIPFADKTLPK